MDRLTDRQTMDGQTHSSHLYHDFVFTRSSSNKLLLIDYFVCVSQLYNSVAFWGFFFTVYMIAIIFINVEIYYMGKWVFGKTVTSACFDCLLSLVLYMFVMVLDGLPGSGVYLGLQLRLCSHSQVSSLCF